jgi:hypothetical protein
MIYLNVTSFITSHQTSHFNCVRFTKPLSLTISYTDPTNKKSEVRVAHPFIGGIRVSHRFIGGVRVAHRFIGGVRVAHRFIGEIRVAHRFIGEVRI